MWSKQTFSRESPRAAAGRVLRYRGPGREKRPPSLAWGIIPYGVGVVCIIFAVLRRIVTLPLFHSPQGLLVLTALCLIAAGFLMFLGIFLISRWEEGRRREASRPAKDPGAENPGPSLRELTDSIDVSLNKLKALSGGIHKQTVVLAALAKGYGQTAPAGPENPAPAKPGPGEIPADSPGAGYSLEKRVYLFYNSRFTEHEFDVLNLEEHLN
jgi:hypothetical protein